MGGGEAADRRYGLLPDGARGSEADGDAEGLWLHRGAAGGNIGAEKHLLRVCRPGLSGADAAGGIRPGAAPADLRRI